MDKDFYSKLRNSGLSNLLAGGRNNIYHGRERVEREAGEFLSHEKDATERFDLLKMVIGKIVVGIMSKPPKISRQVDHFQEIVCS